MYANQHDESFPATVDDLVGYLEGRAAFSNPSYPETGYIYVLGLPPHSEIEVTVERIVMFEEKPFFWAPHSYEKKRYHTNVLFADGHVEPARMTPAQVIKKVITQFGNAPVRFELVRESHSEPLVGVPEYEPEGH